MITSSVNIHNERKGELEKSNNNDVIEISPKNLQYQKYYCSLMHILLIIIPLTVVILFAAIFIPIYIVKNNNKNEKEDNTFTVQDNYNETEMDEEYDTYTENVSNITYAVLTPKDGYDNIFIFLGGISDVSNKYFDFFKSNNTFIPKGTKIYFLSGQPRQMQFMIHYWYIDTPVPGWFNIDQNANLIPNNDFTQAKESLNFVLNEIDRIKNEENVDYKNIYLGGFSQGAMMTNYVLLNSRHELGGYLAFSGYVFDHDFPSNQLVINLNDVQKLKLESKKNYHILATHSYKDNAVFYQLAAPSYQTYYGDYTDFEFLSFGNMLHVFPEQPVHPLVRSWLKKSMKK